MAQELPIALENYINKRCCFPPIPPPRLLINPFYYILIGSGFKLLIN